MYSLEAATIQLSDLERTMRLDAEFSQKRHLRAASLLSKSSPLTITNVAHVSDGNHFTITDEFSDTGIPYYRGQDVVGAFFIEQSSPMLITQRAFQQKHMFRSHLMRGDVLLSIVGTIGESSLFGSNAPATCSCKLAILRPYDIAPEFLAIYLKSKYGRSQIERYTRGAVQKGLLLDDMDQIRVFRGSMEFENQIVRVVGQSKQAVDSAQQYFKNAEDALMKALGLEDWEPPEPLTYVRRASAVISTRRIDAEYFDPGLMAIIEIIADKDAYELCKIAKVGTGFPWSSEYFIEDQLESGEPFVRIRNCKPGTLDIEDLDKLDSNYAKSKGQPKANPGDLVIGMDGLKWFYASLLTGQCYLNQRVAHIERLSNSQISSEFLLAFLNSIFGQRQLLRAMTVAHTVGHITLEDIRSILIPRVKEEDHDAITLAIRESISARHKSRTLLDRAKHAVEIAIEQGENAAMEYLNGAKD